MRHAPPMTGLRVLEAVVRCGGLSGAARALCVSPAAISHRLRDLEAQAGAPLVERRRGAFGATPLGRRVLEALGDAFERIREADAVLAGAAGQGLRIVSSYSFAVLWLAPRLSRFQERHPGVRLLVHPSHDPLAEEGGDITLLHAREPPARAGWTALFTDFCAPVARPDHPLFAAGAPQPGAVLGARLVHVAHGRGAGWGEFSWQSWAAALGLQAPPAAGPTVTAEHLAVDLVLAEQGFALVGTRNAAHLVRQGRLRLLDGAAVATGCSYWVQARAAGGAEGAFLRWIGEELEAEGAPASGGDKPGASPRTPGIFMDKRNEKDQEA